MPAASVAKTRLSDVAVARKVEKRSRHGIASHISTSARRRQWSICYLRQAASGKLAPMCHPCDARKTRRLESPPQNGVQAGDGEGSAADSDPARLLRDRDARWH